ncbi:hypothetical protein L596_011791 [Steinernema carpocapsae]|uniref:N-alpha-acetyltransferase 40 n=1 Tax=Steinernema carpocapsae TaxID=34508 RepID=A0A4U5NV23_STECR|nr:hypothetical protein L596_011791 [Steinernema carpocapsae]
MAPADQGKKLVKKISKMPNGFQHFNIIPENCETIDGEQLALHFPWATHLETVTRDWVGNLFIRNMKAMYEMSKDGFDAQLKDRELFATTSRYIVITKASDKWAHIAYLHYRIDMDNGIPVAYIYELQIEPEYQRKGIGSILVGLVEKLSSRAGLTKIMATVFAFNSRSLTFFHKQGFQADETCPNEDADVDYLILSKQTPYLLA